MAPPAAAAAGTSILARIPLYGRFLVGIALAGLVGFAYWVMFFSDVTNKIKAADNQKKELATKLNEVQAAQVTYLADKDQLAHYQGSEKAFDEIAPPDVQQGAFLSYVQSAAQLSGATILYYAPKEEVAQTYFVKDPMALELVGTFHQIARFTYEISKQGRVINLENIELYDPKLDHEDLKMHVRCLATAFHRPKPKTAQPGAPNK